MIRKAIASIDPEVPVTEAMPLMDQVRGAYKDARIANAVLSCAALLALILCVLFGGGLAFTTTRLLGAWLFGVGSADALSFGVAIAILLAATVTAAYLPARRAMQVDPIVALRYE